MKAIRSPPPDSVKTSDIIFGAASMSSSNVARYAIDLGINVFDTAEGCMNGRSEELLGSALKGVRDTCVIISKHYFGDTELALDTTKAALIEKVNGSLLQSVRASLPQERRHQRNHAIQNVRRRLRA